MKRVLLLLVCSAIISLSGLLPWQRHDAAQLLPVETLLVDYDRRQVNLYAAQGLTGSGASLAEAMDDMADRAPGELFYGQVARVITSPGASALMLQAGIQSRLRLNTAVYLLDGDIAAAAEQVEAMEPRWRAQERRGTMTTLLEFCADGIAPQQITEEELA